MSEVGAPLSSLLSPLPAIILFAHGSRDPEWSAPFQDIRRRVAVGLPGFAVELAYLESMQPTLPDTVESLAAAQCRHITIAPLFMAQGGHLKSDLPRIVGELQRRHPTITMELLPAAGDVTQVRDAISGWLVGAVGGGTREQG